MSKLKAGIVGYGGLGHIHAGSLVVFDDIDITCVCDIDPNRFAEENSEINFEVKKEKLDIRTVNTYENYKEMLEKEELDLMVVALPTDIHAEYSIMALEKGINVFCEKPMSLTTEGCDRMIEAKNKAGKELMIGQCVRFWPEFQWLEDAIKSNRYGKLWSYTARRSGTYPYSHWFLEGERSGGASMDLHVHDIDWVNYIFGNKPDSIQAAGLIGLTGEVDEANVLMKYGDTVVSVHGSWMQHNAFSFYYKANFENATVEHDGSWGEIRITGKNEEFKETVSFNKPNAYMAEMRYFIDTIKGLHKNEICPPESTRDSIELTLKEIKIIKEN